METKSPSPAPNDPRLASAQKRRNMWLGIALLGFVVLMGVGTAIRISQGAGTEPCNGLYWEPVKKECMEPDMPNLDAIGKAEPS